jgi:hypothetical protein
MPGPLFCNGVDFINILMIFITQCFGGKARRKEPHGRPRRRWEDEIRMYFGETGCGSVDWIQLAQDRDRWRALVNTGATKLVMTTQETNLVAIFIRYILY